MTARGATYVVTSRRVVLRVGRVFPVVINVPLAQVESAGVHRFRDGSAQIALRLAPGRARELVAALAARAPHPPALAGAAAPRARARRRAGRRRRAADGRRRARARVGRRAAGRVPAAPARPIDASTRAAVAGTPLAAA
jgi:hypothetical protein